MSSKPQHDQRNSAKAALVLTFKKRRLKASQIPKPVQTQPDNNTNTTSNKVSKSATWY